MIDMLFGTITETTLRRLVLVLFSVVSLQTLQNIYILNVAALDETIIPSCLHFSMQNIEPSRGLCRASRWSNVNVN